MSTRELSGATGIPWGRWGCAIRDPGPLEDDALVVPDAERFGVVVAGESFPEHAQSDSSSPARRTATEKQRGGPMRQRARLELKPR